MAYLRTTVKFDKRAKELFAAPEVIKEQSEYQIKQEFLSEIEKILEIKKTDSLNDSLVEEWLVGLYVFKEESINELKDLLGRAAEEAKRTNNYHIIAPLKAIFTLINNKL